MTNAEPKRQTLKSKLLQNQLLLASAVIVMCSTFYIANDISILRKTMERNVHSIAKVLGHSLVPALAFNDSTEASKVLESLTEEMSITGAYVFTDDKKAFASYGDAHPQLPEFDPSKDAIAIIHGGEMFLHYRLKQDDDTIGSLVIKSSLGVLREEYKSYALIAFGVTFTCLILAMLLANYMQSLLSKPIVTFVHVVKKISSSNDYSVRMKDLGDGMLEELHLLALEFDRMIDHIQTRDRMIQATNEDLEKKVEERTQELREAEKITIRNAHAAGMAEIANGILHNIGNTINSVNISIEEIRSTSTNTKLWGLKKANDLLQQNRADLPAFFSQESGKLLPEYYTKLTESLDAENQKVLEEVGHLAKKVALIKEVVTTQQGYAKGQIFSEELELTDVVDEVLHLQQASLNKAGVEVVTRFDAVPGLLGQKVKLVHVVLNLVKNAKEAMEALPRNRTRMLIIETGLRDGRVPFLRIADTGHGIAKEQLEKIFNHGFTTKENGHGFGLHFCANAMKEMGGSLEVYSAGENQGTTFTLMFKELALERAS